MLLTNVGEGGGGQADGRPTGSSEPGIPAPTLVYAWAVKTETKCYAMGWHGGLGEGGGRAPSPQHSRRRHRRYR